MQRGGVRTAKRIAVVRPQPAWLGAGRSSAKWWSAPAERGKYVPQRQRVRVPRGMACAAGVVCPRIVGVVRARGVERPEIVGIVRSVSLVRPLTAGAACAFRSCFKTVTRASCPRSMRARMAVPQRRAPLLKWFLSVRLPGWD